MRQKQGEAGGERNEKGKQRGGFRRRESTKKERLSSKRKEDCNVWVLGAELKQKGKNRGSLGGYGPKRGRLRNRGDKKQRRRLRRVKGNRKRRR